MPSKVKRHAPISPRAEVGSQHIQTLLRSRKPMRQRQANITLPLSRRVHEPGQRNIACLNYSTLELHGPLFGLGHNCPPTRSADEGSPPAGAAVPRSSRKFGPML